MTHSESAKEPIVLLMRAVWQWSGAMAVAALVTFTTSVSQAQPATESAQASFKYIANVLQTFRGTGRLVNNPGIDGADLEAFVALLQDYYDRFSRDFSVESAMCRFYLDPENGRMTIEEKAQLSFSFLPDLDQRVSRYTDVDREFQQELEQEFGSILLDNVNRAKLSTGSSQQLPLANFDEAAVIAFLDSACI